MLKHQSEKTSILSNAKDLWRHKSALIFLAVAFVLTVAFCQAQENAAPNNSQNGGSMYFLIPVVWDTRDNSLKLKEGAEITLTESNLLEDKGSGSQFYALAIDSNSQPLFFSNGQSRIFLGNWQSKEGNSVTDVNITIPALWDARSIAIFDSKTNKVVFSSSVASVVSNFVQSKTSDTQDQQVVSPENGSVANIPVESSKQSNFYIIFAVVLIFAVVAAGLVIFFLKRRNNKKMLGEKKV